MPTDEATTVATNVLSTIRAISSSYHKRNVFLVPEYQIPSERSSQTVVQVKYPSKSPFGTAGGTYALKIVCEIAVFSKFAGDVLGEWETGLIHLNSKLREIRVALTNKALGGLTIYFYDNGQTMDARPLIVAGERIKPWTWTACRFQGAWHQQTLDFAP